MSVVMTAAPEFAATCERRQYVRPVGWGSCTAGAAEFVEPGRAAPGPGPTPPEPPQAKVEGQPVGRAIVRDGRLREEVLADSDRTFAIMMHLSPLAFLWIGPFALAIPLVMWLMRKEQSRFTDDHGREIVNFMITWVLLSVALVWTLVVPIILTIVAIVSIIRGSVAASRNEYFRYPMTIRFLS